MNRSAFGLFLLLALSAVSTGCASTRTDTFDIEVRNATAKPLTLSLAKDGPPYEAAWARPEDAAIETPQLRERWVGGETGMGQLLAPGKTAFIKELHGKFADRSHGYVRAYAGDLSKSISQMLARGPDSPDRVDVPLMPGPNRIVIREKASRLVAEADDGK